MAALPLPSLSPGPPVGDALWQRAASGDPIDLQRLADREGALALIAGVERGGTQGLTGLAALPYAEDAELAIGPLCDLAPRLQRPGRRNVLGALNGVIAAIDPDGERLAAADFARCASTLERLAKGAALGPAERDLASSSHAMLLEYVEPIGAR